MITADAAGTWTLGDQTVNRMGFGSMRLTPNPDLAVAREVLRRAVELGVNHIDTAAFYVSPGGILDVGTGAARFATELIRAALSPYDPSLFIATKVGPGLLPSGEFEIADTPVRLRAQVEENLRRLGVDRLDLVNLRLTRRGGSIADRFAALAALRDEGLIRHLGLSNATLEQVDEASAIAPVVCVQNSFALDLRRDEALARASAVRDIAFVPFFAIAGTSREDGASPVTDDAVTSVAAAHGVTPHQVRLAWTLHQGDNVLAIPGTGDVSHLEQNIAAAALRFTPEELARLN
ncbi:aldo/keto reductase [Paractinoplanes abujensis]|uniref:Aryl-alcohol dehydrogenase-like predicted oxidoreductase n=1 Tax=Paractinoplanes abujensis TaxID=882441 RepID=A0A7W7G594_9ACTN|nr:aldo/keto reductase [Actinoplanes abujensis]MBB4694691.1 aryl-alcohol dehydrogenase-like predicted oxidoreductase [Actinoplanes abujensis]